VANDPLAKLAQKNMEEVGGCQYTAEENHFAAELQKSLPPGTHSIPHRPGPSSLCARSIRTSRPPPPT
jgi:hypothetical protein